LCVADGSLDESRVRQVVGRLVDSWLSGGRDSRDGGGIGYFVSVMVLQLVLGILASMIVAWFSRYREFRADAGSARLLGTPRPMVDALRRLGGLEAGDMPKALSGFGITDRGGMMSLFATHPPIEARIAALNAPQS